MAADKLYPSDYAERFQVRMPAGLRQRIALAADASKRSMNAEIVFRLEASFPRQDETEPPHHLANLAQQLAHHLSEAMRIQRLISSAVEPTDDR